MGAEIGWPGTVAVPRSKWRPGGRGSFVAEETVAEEARTRGFAAPAFAGCAFIDGLVREPTIKQGGDYLGTYLAG